MSGWSVELLDARVERELSLLNEDLQARFVRLMEMVQEHGTNALHAPHAKHLEASLWELRMKGKSGIARAIYVTVKDRRLVVVHVFAKKSQATPNNALKTARNRSKEILS